MFKLTFVSIFIDWEISLEIPLEQVDRLCHVEDPKFKPGQSKSPSLVW